MKQISPGGEANITVKVSTKGYGGRKISEKVDIYTNDSRQPSLSVVVTGLVEKFVNITPARAVLTGASGSQIESRIAIVPEPRFPFKITNTRMRDGKHIRFRLEEQIESDKLSYLLIIENIKAEPGRYADIVYLETDQDTLPTIQVYVTGNVLYPQ